LLQTRRTLRAADLDLLAAAVVAAVGDPSEVTWLDWVDLGIAHGCSARLGLAFEELALTHTGAVADNARSALWEIDAVTREEAGP
jgi:hypothetical protein